MSSVVHTWSCNQGLQFMLLQGYRFKWTIWNALNANSQWELSSQDQFLRVTRWCIQCEWSFGDAMVAITTQIPVFWDYFRGWGLPCKWIVFCLFKTFFKITTLIGSPLHLCVRYTEDLLCLCHGPKTMFLIDRQCFIQLIISALAQKPFFYNCTFEYFPMVSSAFSPLSPLTTSTPMRSSNCKKVGSQGQTSSTVWENIGKILNSIWQGAQ